MKYFFILFFMFNCAVERDRVTQNLLSILQMLDKSRYNNQSNATGVNPVENPRPNPETIPPSLIGNNNVYASLNIEANTGVDRYKDLEINFTHSMQASSVENSFKLEDSSGYIFNRFNGTFTWFNEKRVFFTPFAELKQRENYTLTITANAITSDLLYNLTPFSKTFQSQPVYSFEIILNGIQYSQNNLETAYTNQNGFIFDSTISPNVNLTFTVKNSELINSLKLFKMNDFGNSPTDPFFTFCTPCSGPTFSSTTNLNSLSGSLAPRQGSNTYYFEVIDIRGKIFRNTFSFHWGNLQKNNLAQPSPNEWVVDSVAFLLDKQNNIPVIERVIREWGRGQFTLVGKTVNSFLNENLINTPGSGCLPFSKWDPVNQASPATIANQVPFQFTYIPRIGPFCGINVEGFALYGADNFRQTITYANQTFIDVDSLTSPGIFANMYVLDPTNSGLIPDRTKILSITNPIANRYRLHLDKTILSSNSWINLNYKYAVPYKAIADGYVSNVFLPLVDQTLADFNLQSYITPRQNFIDLTLGAKKAQGRAAIVAQLLEIEPHLASIAPVGARFTFHDNLLSYNDGPAVGFQLNPSNNIQRFLTATINPNVNPSGKVLIDIHNSNPFSSNICNKFNSYCSVMSNYLFLPNISPEQVNPVLSPNFIMPTLDYDSLWTGNSRVTKMNPLITNWAENISTNNVTSSGAVGAILADIASQIIPDYKFKIVQQASNDILTRLVPELLDVILKQLKGWEPGDQGSATTGKGMLIKLPDTGLRKYPYPFRKITFDVRAKPSFARSQETPNAKLIEGRVSTKILVEQTANAEPSITSTPPNTSPSNQQSFLLLRDQATPVPFQTNRSHNTDMTGLLLAVHGDAVNQAMYNFWKIGGLNIKLDQTFLNDLKTFLGGDTDLTSFLDTILKGSNFRQILAPGKVSLIKWKDSTRTQTVTIENSDKIEFTVVPYLPPVIKAHMGPDPDFMQDPQLEFAIHDLIINIQGRKTDNSVYNIAKVKASLSTRIKFGISLYSDINYPSANSYRRALNLKVSSEPVDLRYKIEFGRGSNENPLGLDPDYIHVLVDPLVSSLILPLLNDVLKELPLPLLEGCGLNVFNLKQEKIEKTTPDPYLLLNAKLFKTSFTGDCSIQ